MLKVTTSISVKGMDVKEMMTAAKDQMADLGDIPWKITEMNIWMQEDMATKEGMMRMYCASVSMEANVNE